MRYLALVAALAVAHPTHAASDAQLLRGSRAAVDRQLAIAERLDMSLLTRENYAEFRKHGYLVRFPETRTLRYKDLDTKYRYTRPYVRDFLLNLAGLHYTKWKQPLTVTSGARTREYQISLQGNNRNAIAANRSLHVRGMAIDITTKGMSKERLAWLRATLIQLERKGRIDVTEEKFGQLCFHIVVYPATAEKKAVGTGKSTS